MTEKKRFLKYLRNNGPNSFYTEIRGCIVLLPESAWSASRDAGITKVEDMLDKVRPETFDVIAVLADRRLSSIRLSSLWRPGNHPHGWGLGIDVGAYTTSGSPGETVSYAGGVRVGGRVPAAEDEISRVIWSSGLITQWISPYWIRGVRSQSFNSNNRWYGNRGLDPVEKQHLDHLHLTVES